MQRRAWFRLAAAAAVALATGSTAAGEFHLQELTIVDPWAPATPPMAPMGAAFLEIRNAGTDADRLVAAQAAIAGAVELHTHEMHGGVAHMRQIDGIDVPAGGGVVLGPGGLHVMLIDLAEPLQAGTSFPLRLDFARAGTVEVVVEVRGMGQMPHGGHQHGAPTN